MEYIRVLDVGDDILNTGLWLLIENVTCMKVILVLLLK